jgi:hypothetical protein
LKLKFQIDNNGTNFSIELLCRNFKGPIHGGKRHITLMKGWANHMAIALPGNGSFLVISHGELWNDVTAAGLLEIDTQGNALWGQSHADANAVCIPAAVQKRLGYARYRKASGRRAASA